MSAVVPIRKRQVPNAALGLALAGGAPEGALYELGALLALEESVAGLDLNRLGVYVGVSSGAIVAACLANRIPTAEILRGITSSPGQEENPFRSDTLFTTGYGEYFRRLWSLPRLLVEALGSHLAHPGDMTLRESLTHLFQALPVGLFDNEPLHLYLAHLFSEPGRTDDFRRLRTRLRVVATELDGASPAVFGRPGLDHVPISRALQASAALPGLYPPVEIEGRDYVDGVLLKTMHGSVALEEGAKLLICINPIVPVDTARAVEAGVMKRGKLADRGLPAVLSQMLRTMIRSRLGVGMRAYESEFPDSDVVLFEPPRDDYRMFFTNIFSFSDRRAVCAHAYRQTRAQLLARRHELSPIFARHGLGLRLDVLAGPERLPWGEDAAPRRRRDRRHPTAGVEHDLARLDRCLDRLEALTLPAEPAPHAPRRARS